MIELYDAARLQTRKDLSLPLAAAALLLAAAALGTYGWRLQGQLALAEHQRAQFQQQLKQAQGQAAPSNALLADLQREAERLESEGQADPQRAVATGPSPSQWLLRLGDLSSADISLSRIEVDRGGAVRLEGLAVTPQSVSRLVQQWDRSQATASPVPARSIDVRQELATAPLLSFKLRAAAPPGLAMPSSTSPAAAPSNPPAPKAST